MGEEHGAVSLWVALVKDSGQIEESVRSDYTEDGDWIAPPFAEAFGIEYFDEDFLEAEMLEAPKRRLAEILRGLSYDTILIPRFETLVGEEVNRDINGVILLANFRFAGNPTARTVGDVEWRFVGATTYT